MQKTLETKVNKVKNELKTLLEKTPQLGVVGRIKDWLYDPESRYPVSCTVLSVEDSMDGENGIEYSWLYVSKGLRYGAGVALDVSKLRPNGDDNGRGLVSSGATSFTRIYSSLNEVLRRGGKFKNGAVVVYMDASHPDLLEFLSLTPSEAPWIKKAIYVDDNPLSPDFILNNPNIARILTEVRYGTAWLAKKRWFHPTLKKTVNYPIDVNNPDTDRLYSQVCLEILLRTNATCLLSHINLGQCTIKNLRQSFRRGMKFICELHGITGAGRDNFYLSPKEDKQVGLGVFGLANLLARYKVSYQNFTFMLTQYLELTKNFPGDNMLLAALRKVDEKAFSIVEQLYLAFQDAAVIARRYKMERAFTVAPTASCSFRYTDLNGYTTTPEISPPICHPVTKKTVRDSSTFGQIEYSYPPNVETAAEVGWDTYYQLAQTWQNLMENTGLAHSISFNVWNECPVDMSWFKDWLLSPLVTTYYRMLVEQDFVDKSTIDTGGLSESLSENTAYFFIPEDAPIDLLSVGSKDENPVIEADFLTQFKAIQCSIVDNAPSEDMCVACAE